jgi:hypothetical protein
MADCELLQGCIFFNDKMQNMPDIAESMKKKYCRGDNSMCARYMVFKVLGGDKVPADLYPGQTDRVDKILAGS